MLKPYYSNNKEIVEIGVDEVGRGPMFGRVYCAAVILPRNNFKHELMKDSKRFHSKNKLEQTAEYIKENCIAYAIAFQDEESIDKYNIKNATYMAMHKAIKNIVGNNVINKDSDYLVLVDGRDFKSLTYFDNDKESIQEIASICIEGGDNYIHIYSCSIYFSKSRKRQLYLCTL